MSMMEPRIDDLLNQVDSKYTLIIMAAQRARQINAYYSQLGEGIGEFVPPLVPHATDDKALSTALKEIAAEKVAYERTVEGIK
jgi:DNA-directed RNA polymerase subunit omega